MHQPTQLQPAFSAETRGGVEIKLIINLNAFVFALICVLSRRVSIFCLVLHWL